MGTLTGQEPSSRGSRLSIQSQGMLILSVVASSKAKHPQELDEVSKIRGRERHKRPS